MLWAQDIKLEKLPATINKPGVNQGTSMMTYDGQRIYFGRYNGEANGWDIFSSDLVNGQWQEGINLGKAINNKNNNVICGISEDGNTLYLKDVYSKNGVLAYATQTLDGWSEPVICTIEGYDELVKDLVDLSFAKVTVPSGKTKSYNLQQIVFITADYQHIFFSQGVESDGKFTNKHIKEDLYLSSKVAGKSDYYDEPLPITALNTKDIEGYPALAADNKTLYFCSDRPGGYGGLDIYMTQRLDDTWLNWSEPINLGPKVNSEKDERSFKPLSDGKRALLASGGVVYFIDIPEEARPNPVVVISGVVTNAKTQAKMPADIIYYRLSDGKEMGVAHSHPRTGAYSIALPFGEKYGFRASEDGFMAISENIDLTDNSKGFQTITKDLSLVPIEQGQAIRLNNLFFEVGKADILPDSYAELAQVVEMLQKNPALKFEIGGHTDNTGSLDLNNALSLKRANAVRDYLIAKGIGGDRLVAKGYGPNKPVADNATPDGRQLNRRVEISVL